MTQESIEILQQTMKVFEPFWEAANRDPEGTAKNTYATLVVALSGMAKIQLLQLELAQREGAERIMELGLAMEAYESPLSTATIIPPTNARPVR